MQTGTITVGAKLAGGTQQAFKAIADGMRTVANSMRTLAKDTRALGQSAQSKAYRAMAKEMNSMATNLDKVSKGTVDVVVQTKALTAATDDASKSHDQLNAQLTEQVEKEAKASAGMKKHEAAAKVLSIRYNELLRSTDKNAANARGWIAQLEKGNADMGVAREKLARYNREFVEGIAAQNKFAQALNKVQVEHEELINSNTKLGRQAKFVHKEFEKGKLTFAQYETQLNKIQKEYKEATLNFERAWKAADSLDLQYRALLQSGTKFAADGKKIVQSLRNTDISAKKAKEALIDLNVQFKKTEAGVKAAQKIAVAFSKLKSKFVDLKNSQTAYGAGARKLIQRFKEEKISIDQLNMALTHLAKREKEVARAQEQANRAMLKARNAASRLSNKYRELIAGNTKYALTAQRVVQMLREQKISADRAAYSLERLRQRGMHPLGAAFNRLNRSFKTYMSYVAASSTIFLFIGAMREATRTVIDFDQALKDLQAITRATDEEVYQMGERIKQVASDTKFSAVEVAEGMKLLGQSGLSAQEAIDTIGAVSNLATGTLTDLATTVDLVTTALRVWDIEASNSSHIADVFANAVNRSKLTIDKIRTSLNYIGPVAQAAGASVEETASAMMIMANQGIRASTIGTGLRQVLRRLVDPSTAMKQAMAAANMTMADFDIRALGLGQVLDNLSKVVVNNADAFHMFGQRGATAVLAVTKNGKKALDEMMVIVEQTGSAADMAAIQMEGLGVSFKNLQDKVKNLYIALGDAGLAGALSVFVDAARSLTDLMTGTFNNAVVSAISKFTLLTAVTYGLGKGIVLLTKWLGIGGLVKGLQSAKAAMIVYTVSSTGATVATLKFSRALKGLAVIGRRFWPFLIAAGVAGLLQYVSALRKANTATEENLRKSRALEAKYRDSARALEGLLTKLDDANITDEDREDILRRLIRVYPLLADEIRKAKGDTEALTEAVKNQITELTALADRTAKYEMQDMAKIAMDAQREMAKIRREIEALGPGDSREKVALEQQLQEQETIYENYIKSISVKFEDYKKRHNETMKDTLFPGHEHDAGAKMQKDASLALFDMHGKLAVSAMKRQAAQELEYKLMLDTVKLGNERVQQESELVNFYMERLGYTEAAAKARAQMVTSDPAEISKGYERRLEEYKKTLEEQTQAAKRHHEDEGTSEKAHQDVLAKLQKDRLEKAWKLAQDLQVEANHLGNPEAMALAADEVERIYNELIKHNSDLVQGRVKAQQEANKAIAQTYEDDVAKDKEALEQKITNLKEAVATEHMDSKLAQDLEYDETAIHYEKMLAKAKEFQAEANKKKDPGLIAQANEAVLKAEKELQDNRIKQIQYEKQQREAAVQDRLKAYADEVAASDKALTTALTNIDKEVAAGTKGAEKGAQEKLDLADKHSKEVLKKAKKLQKDLAHIQDKDAQKALADNVADAQQKRTEQEIENYEFLAEKQREIDEAKKQSYEDDVKAYGKSLDAKNLETDIAAAMELRTEEETLAKKYRDRMDYNERVLARAKEHQQSVADSENQALKAEAAAAVGAAEDQLYADKLARLQYFHQQRAAALDEIEQMNKQTNEEIEAQNKRHAEQVEELDKARKTSKEDTDKKIIELEKDLVKKLAEIDKDLEDKRKEFARQRIQIEKDAKQEILDIENSFAEQMLRLEQRGMSDAEKELSDESFAREQFAKAQKAKQQGILQGDEELLAVSKELFDSSAGYFSNLADTGAARSGLTAIKDQKIAIAKALERIKQAQVDTDEGTAKTEADAAKAQAKADMEESLMEFKGSEADKLQAVQDRITEERVKEKELHDEKMRQRNESIEKLKEEIQLIEQSRQATLNANVQQPAGSQADTPQTGASTNISQEDEKRLVKVHERAAAEGIAKGIKDKGVTAAMEEVSGEGIGEKIAEDVNVSLQENLFKDVKVDGMPLEDWKKMGEEQGKEAGEAAGEQINEEVGKAVAQYNEEGEVIGLQVDVPGDQLDDLVDRAQDYFEDSPFELGIDQADFERQMSRLVRDAQTRYKITIPVTVSQRQAEGGPVYHMAGGGRLPGQSSPYDSVNVKARPGEWFIRNEAVAEWQRRIGDWFMPGVNRPNSTPGKYLQSLLVHGTQQNAVPEIPEMGTITVRSGSQQAQIMATPNEGRKLFDMLQDLEAFST